MSLNNTAATTATENVSRGGLGYGMAIAVGILVFVSAIMLASYICIRLQGGRGHVNTNSNGVRERNSSSNNSAAVNIVINCIGESTGLNQSAIDSYPKLVFYRRQQLPRPQDTCCSICLGEYKYREVLRLLPDCRHCFHAGCVDAWLRMNPSCPVCRASSPLPSPSPSVTSLPTPLSELIPLAIYSNGRR